MSNAQKELYKEVIYEGCSVDAKGVSLCNLENTMTTALHVPKDKYQVFSKHHDYHRLFRTLDDAVETFISLKDNIRG
jgi:hypothetical protein